MLKIHRIYLRPSSVSDHITIGDLPALSNTPWKKIFFSFISYTVGHYTTLISTLKNCSDTDE